jgi:hypothetical protein
VTAQNIIFKEDSNIGHEKYGKLSQEKKTVILGTKNMVNLDRNLLFNVIIMA